MSDDMTYAEEKPFVGGLVVPYFMDHKMIKQVMTERDCTKQEAIEALTKLWMKEKGRGN
jgi:hypothetical protein